MRVLVRWLLWVIVALVGMTGPLTFVSAQEETETPTPTPTITPTPDFRALLPVGAVIPWAGNSTPEGWRVANGDCLEEIDFPLLYAAIGTIYGECELLFPVRPGFRLPDIQGRSIVGAGHGGQYTGENLTIRSPGDHFGAETHQLTIAEMPSHDHPRNPNNHSDEVYIRAATGGAAGYGSSNHPVVTASLTGLRGGGLAFDIIQPSLVLNYIINVGTEPLNIGGNGGYSTPMPTPSPLPEIMVYSTVAAGEVSQPVAFSYSVTAGDFVIAMLLFLSIGLTGLRMLFEARKGAKAA